MADHAPLAADQLAHVAGGAGKPAPQPPGPSFHVPGEIGSQPASNRLQWEAVPPTPAKPR
jgi:hypothetical protein